MISIEKDIRVAGILHDSIVDGPGLRLTIFFQGCPRSCEGCHNPESQDFDSGKLSSAEKILEDLDNNPLTQGVTFSGGEPFSRAEALLPLAAEIKKRKLELAIYTGYTIEEILEDGDKFALDLLGMSDVIIDGPFILEQRSLTLPFRGSHNQRILDSKKSLTNKKAVPISDTLWKYNV